MGNIKLLIYNGKKGWDVSKLVQEITWSGRKGSLARVLEVTLSDDDTKGQDRIKIDVEKGYTCVFKWKGKEKFRGIIMRQTQSEKKELKIKAYDECIYLANSLVLQANIYPSILSAICLMSLTGHSEKCQDICFHPAFN